MTFPEQIRDIYKNRHLVAERCSFKEGDNGFCGLGAYIVGKYDLQNLKEKTDKEIKLLVKKLFKNRDCLNGFTSGFDNENYSGMNSRAFVVWRDIGRKTWELVKEFQR